MAPNRHIPQQRAGRRGDGQDRLSERLGCFLSVDQSTKAQGQPSTRRPDSKAAVWKGPITRYRNLAALLVVLILGACAESAVPATTSAPTTTIPSITRAEVYRRVSPSIAFVDTPIGSGSGILIEGGYVVTNQHVVWPYKSIRVVFPDGTELQDVPVVAWDFMRDLAVLGPVEVSANPLRLEDGEGMVSGEELLMVGYPIEVESTPQATITSGILSRVRQWEKGEVTLFQSDAAIAGGQSGGALLDAKGRVIGITTFSASDFGLALSTADIAPFVKELIDGEHDFDKQPLFAESGGFEFDVEVRNLPHPPLRGGCGSRDGDRGGNRRFW